MNGTGSVGIPWIVILGFVRIAAHPRILESPLEVGSAASRRSSTSQVPRSTAWLVPVSCDESIPGWRVHVQGSSTVAPVVSRASSARWASAARASGWTWLTAGRTAPRASTSNSSSAPRSRSSRFAR